MINDLEMNIKDSLNAELKRPSPRSPPNIEPTYFTKPKPSFETLSPRVNEQSFNDRTQNRNETVSELTRKKSMILEEIEDESSGDNYGLNIKKNHDVTSVYKEDIEVMIRIERNAKYLNSNKQKIDKDSIKLGRESSRNNDTMSIEESRFSRISIQEPGWDFNMPIKPKSKQPSPSFFNRHKRSMPMPEIRTEDFLSPNKVQPPRGINPDALKKRQKVKPFMGKLK